MYSRFQHPTQMVVAVLSILGLVVFAQTHAAARTPTVLPEPVFFEDDLFEPRLLVGQAWVGQASDPTSPTIHFTPPPDDGAPDTDQAGGRRDQLCGSSEPTPSFTLLMPPSNQGKTFSPHPTFWVYVPPVSAQSIFLKLEDEQGNYYLHTVFPITEQSGVMGLPLPNTLPELELDRRFKVSLALTCGAVIDPNDPVLEAWVTRIAPADDEGDVPNPEISLERARGYADRGIWFDALTALARLRQEHPNQSDIQVAWNTFLTSVELDIFGELDRVDPIETE